MKNKKVVAEFISCIKHLKNIDILEKYLYEVVADFPEGEYEVSKINDNEYMKDFIISFSFYYDDGADDCGLTLYVTKNNIYFEEYDFYIEENIIEKLNAIYIDDLYD